MQTYKKYALFMGPSIFVEPYSLAGLRRKILPHQIETPIKLSKFFLWKKSQQFETPLGVLAPPPVSVNIIEESVDDYLEDDNDDVEDDVLGDLNFDSHALAEVVIDNPEEVVNNQIILDIGDAIFDIFLQCRQINIVSPH